MVSPHRADIQGLRAIAVLLVVVFHSGLPVPGGFAGVDVFFVISGFVITAMLLREHAATGRISLHRFYIRRFKRLTPALAVMVLVVVVLSIIFLPPLLGQAATFQTALGAMLLYANYAAARFSGGYFDGAARLNPLLHTWTLSLEEQFYLIFPALLIVGLALAARTGWKRWPFVAIGALGATSLVIALVTSPEGILPPIPDGLIGFYGPLGRAWEFAAGALLAIAVPHLRPLGRITSLVAAIVGTAALLATAFLLSGQDVFPGVATLVPVAGTVLLLVAGTARNPISSALSWRPVTFLGDISYSLYLWHWPFIAFTILFWPGNRFARLLAVLLALVVAYASYRWLETPLRTRTLSRRQLGLAVAAVLIPPIAVTGLASLRVADGYGIQALRDAQRALDSHAGYVSGCLSYQPIDDERMSRCVWNSDTGGTPVYLVGDSMADHFSDGLIAAGAEAGRPVTVAVAAGCPVYSVVLPRDGEPVDVTALQHCGPYESTVQSWLVDQPPGLVLIAQTDTAWWEPSPAIPEDVELFSVPDAVKAAEVERSLRAVVARFQAAGHTVVLTMPPPSFRYPVPGWDPMRCTITDFAAASCSGTRTVDDLDVLQRPMRDIIARIADDTGAGIFDLRDRYCADGICTTDIDGHTAFMDSIHLSVAESLALTPRFVELMESGG